MAKHTLIIITDKFEEMEFVCPFDVLLRGGVSVTTAGRSGSSVVGFRGLRLQTDVKFSDIAAETYDCVVLVGGPGCYTLRGDEPLKNFLVRHSEAEKLLCAICAAPLILHDAGLLQGKKHTAHPCTHDELTAAIATESVVADGNLITGAGPGVAAKFAFKILEHLTDKSTADSTAKSMVL
ncbi:MAG: DJ-1/PfpI family protein [Puniceicoccales bacterium]|jgi:4-methyl-5(b-hydroxyethyl)-thiazole monophosphate biosynthesis|nr:DJ-1/PfpI family protein [Puniceicoccales bacterium]